MIEDLKLAATDALGSRIFSSRRRHTRFALVSWARRCVIRDSHFSDDGRLKPIEGVSIYLAGLKRGAFTDEKGAYAFAQVPRGKYEITIDHIAYEKVIDSIDVLSLIHI